MKIKERTPERLVLAGTPGGWSWMVFACVVGAALVCVFGTILYRTVGTTGVPLHALAMGAGVVIGLVIFGMGAVTLAVGHERLELDLAAGTGRYDVKSPIVDTGSTPFTFDLAAVHSVTLERSGEDRPRHDGRGRMDATVVRARLRTVKPRRAVVLDETENGRDERVERVASTVAEFLGLDITRTGG